MIFQHFLSAPIRNLLLSFDVSSIEKVKKMRFSMKISWFSMWKCLLYCLSELPTLV